MVTMAKSKRSGLELDKKTSLEQICINAQQRLEERIAAQQHINQHE